MKKLIIVTVVLSSLLANQSLTAQVGVNTITPSSASVLDVSSSSDNINFGGLLPPRVDTVGRADITSKATAADDGMLIFYQDGTTRCLQIWDGTNSLWQNIYCMPTGPVGPTLIGIQDFEIMPATPTLPYIVLNAGTFQTGNGTSPATATYIDSRSYGVNNDLADIDFGPVDASSYTNVTARIRMASFSVGNATDGSDLGDYIDFYISLDGGNTYSYELEITGNANARYDFNATGTQSIVYDGNNTATSFATPTGTNGISYVEITGIPNSANLVLGIVMVNNANRELWVIDNVELIGN